MSPARAAAALWGRNPLTEELPHIRSFSDISWAFWNRAAAGNIQGIKYFMATMVRVFMYELCVRQTLTSHVYSIGDK